jgi:ABC-type ATPase involved in cell division
MALFHQFKDLGSTVLVASHDIDLIKDQGCRILHLSKGALVQDTQEPSAMADRA